MTAILEFYFLIVTYLWSRSDKKCDLAVEEESKIRRKERKKKELGDLTSHVGLCAQTTDVQSYPTKLSCGVESRT